MPSKGVRPCCEVCHHAEYVVLGDKRFAVEASEVPALIVFEGLVHNEIRPVQVERRTGFHNVAALETADRSVCLHGSAETARFEIFEWVVNGSFQDLMPGGYKHLEKFAQFGGDHDALFVIVDDPRLSALLVPARSALLDGEMEAVCLQLRAIRCLVSGGNDQRCNWDGTSSKCLFDMGSLAL